jgi:hypothetical protein
LAIGPQLLTVGVHHLSLPASAKLLALSLHRLRLAASAKLLALGLPGLGRLDPSRLHLLTRRMALDLAIRLLLDTIGASLLLTFDSCRALSGDPRLSPFDTLRTRLLALGAHLDALGTLWTFGRREALSTLHARRGHLPLSAWRLLALSLLALGLRLLAFGACGLPVLLGPRIGRGRDRQSGDTRGEKYPGHHNFSFLTALTAMGPRRSHASTARMCVLAHQDEPQISLLFRELI